MRGVRRRENIMSEETLVGSLPFYARHLRHWAVKPFHTSMMEIIRCERVRQCFRTNEVRRPVTLLHRKRSLRYLRKLECELRVSLLNLPKGSSRSNQGTNPLHNSSHDELDAKYSPSSQVYHQVISFN